MQYYVIIERYDLDKIQVEECETIKDAERLINELDKRAYFKIINGESITITNLYEDIYKDLKFLIIAHLGFDGDRQKIFNTQKEAIEYVFEMSSLYEGEEKRFIIINGEVLKVHPDIESIQFKIVEQEVEL